MLRLRYNKISIWLLFLLSVVYMDLPPTGDNLNKDREYTGLFPGNYWLWVQENQWLSATKRKKKA